MRNDSHPVESQGKSVRRQSAGHQHAVDRQTDTAASSAALLTYAVPGVASAGLHVGCVGTDELIVSGSQPAAEEHTIQGTLNQIDSDQKYLILIADDAYYRFDFSECDSDLSGLEPGDSVTLTYTGTPDQDSEDVTAQLVSITKDT